MVESALRVSRWCTVLGSTRVTPTGLEAHAVYCEKKGEWRVALRSATPAGTTRIALLDHHGDPLTNGLVLDAKSTWSIGSFDMPATPASANWGSLRS